MMQTQHNLIKIEGKIGINQELHNRKLEIAKSNIVELNKRWNNVNEVVYVVEKLKFEPSDYTDSRNYSVVDLLNKYINWDLSEGKDREYQIQTYLRSIQNKFEELNTELHYRRLTNGLNDEDIEDVKIFISNFHFLSPTGFLSEMEKDQIESRLNEYCEVLEKNYISVPEIELSLENYEPLREINLDHPAEKSIIESGTSLNQIFSKYFRVRSNEISLWTRLIG
ncbi:hypothetical protein [Moheibacter sediminis]|uniref:Uncharacterized protein n=1 Tax=Moheibacter sediminis TaxID=1434700 RepID=A0A1W2AQZ8_9FLAO|nr:hypothetical protein [Moheibacter sediminis]SMC62950.1 hypothetical protein SAMN06296427_1058 [Moheibacter sediminis]